MRLPVKVPPLLLGLLLLGAPSPLWSAEPRIAKSEKEALRLEQEARKKGKLTRRIEAGAGGPGLLAERDPCTEAFGSCWSRLICTPGGAWCICWADRDCVDRRGEE